VITSVEPDLFPKHRLDRSGVTAMGSPGTEHGTVFEAHRFGSLALYLKQQLLKIKKITLKAWLALLTRSSYVKALLHVWPLSQRSMRLRIMHRHNLILGNRTVSTSMSDREMGGDLNIRKCSHTSQ